MKTRISLLPLSTDIHHTQVISVQYVSGQWHASFMYCMAGWQQWQVVPLYNEASTVVQLASHTAFPCTHITELYICHDENIFCWLRAVMFIKLATTSTTPDPGRSASFNDTGREKERGRGRAGVPLDRNASYCMCVREIDICEYSLWRARQGSEWGNSRTVAIFLQLYFPIACT